MDTISDIALDLGEFALDNELRNGRKISESSPRMKTKSQVRPASRKMNEMAPSRKTAQRAACR